MKKPSIKAPKLKAPQLKRSGSGAPAEGGAGYGEPGDATASGGAAPAGGRTLPGGVTRTTQSLLAAAAVLAVVFGIAELRPPVAPAAAATGGAVTTTQVERVAAVCPQPIHGLTGSTAYTLYSPVGAKATGGSAVLADVAPPPAQPANPAPAPSGSGAPAAQVPPGARALLVKPGVPAIGQAAGADQAPGTAAVATGGYAPGFTVGQTSIVTDQAGTGMSGLTCTPAGTSFWFAGASTDGDRVDYVSLVNAESTGAVVDLKLYGDKGPIDVDAANGITLAPGTSQAIRLKTLAPGVKDLTVHAVVRNGRVGAGLHTTDGTKGADWLPASVEPAPTAVLPGLPADATNAHLVVAAPGDDDADLKIQVSGKNGWFTPAGHESIHVKSGMVSAVDLGQVTRGEVGALRLTPSDPAHQTPIVAGLRIDRSQNGKSDVAWVSGSAPVGQRASVADNRGGGSGTLYLTSAGEAAKVRITASAGINGGTPATKELPIPAGATVSLPSPEPNGLNGSYGLTVETLSGGPVVAARMLAITTNNVPMFTIQALRDDHSTVQVPQAAADPGVLLR
ncbi:hypothetical protein CFP65_2735 [Kitasatospora sp. MMS16-BH015]|uniref:DUF5719 family protein n=1 Tax=Kitasatospora sp. MMS16-BH015 TaxID=2018025 RepID=UPI000CA1381B|nr:DUF5719 family protein [Kitasatospora sp. MMS16-BH015]AUG77554.1 hypothetical protein CFP65_2735 [Kitasatospora sp. MMS16-BH015]